MQCATKSNREVLNARAAAAALDVTEHLRAARASWLAEARRSIRYAREWRGRFGGPLHHEALGMYLQYISEAAIYRDWARTVGRVP